MKILTALLVMLTFCVAATGQNTTFTYQGRLTDQSVAANGQYSFEFKLFDTPTPGTGTQAGATLTREYVTVTSGVFTVELDYNSNPNPFTGAARFLEIAVRPANSGGAYTILSPRHPVTSAPYAIRSREAATANSATNSAQLGGVPAARFVQSDAGGNVSIGGNLNIAGTLTQPFVNAQNEFRINGSRVLRSDGFGLFVGFGAGSANTNGFANTFVGLDAGAANTTGSLNSFFGSLAGDANVDGNSNSFFGQQAGWKNTSGSSNSFFGASAGFNNTTGPSNSFFGGSAGASNATGGINAFFGLHAGSANVSGNGNTFLGSSAGDTNASGSFNTAVGWNADVGANNLTYATAIGAGAKVSTSNTIELGRPGGFDTVYIPGRVQINSLGAAGTTSLCRNAVNQISTCSSSLRYKTNIKPFDFGLNLVNRLKPISFDWKEGGMKDFGLGAEDVAAVEPLMVTYNDKGEVEGVKYDRIGVVLLNVVKEQQTQIETQQAQIQTQTNQIKEQQYQADEQEQQIREQQKQLQQQQLVIDGLRKLVCSQNPQAEVCKEIQK
jgi:hypothetical protein